MMNYQKWDERNGKNFLFFFYLVDTKNVRISRKKSETIRQEIFKERIKDMIFEKKIKRIREK